MRRLLSWLVMKTTDGWSSFLRLPQTVRTLLEELRPRVPSLTAKLVRRLLKQIKVDASLETLTDE